MQIKIFTFNPFQVNTYLLYDDSKEAIVIDPAMVEKYEQKAFETFINENNLTLKAVYNTHGHMDHVAGSHWIKETYHISPCGHKDDDDLIEAAQIYANSYGFDIKKPEPVKTYLQTGDVIKFGNQELEVRHVPGHSPGGLIYIHHQSKVVFSGDSLFASSIGRTDLPGGSYDQLIYAIKTQLLTLNDDYQVFPGHGPSTDIKTEKTGNLYLNPGYFG